ncbi:MAG: NADPH-dependent F420 reductase [bacterium]|nr:NADPH-dependent F420 reductase [bacterium]
MIQMKIGVIGAGRMGGNLARRWAAAGHQVMIGSRTPDKARQVAGEIGHGVQGGSHAETAAFADVILLSVPFKAAHETLDGLGDLGGKVVIECTNDMSGQRDDSANSAQAVAGWARNARVVKAFNTVFWDILTLPRTSGLGAVFMAGDDAAAKQAVAALIRDAGFDPVDVGGLNDAHYLDTLVRLIIHLGFQQGMGRNLAYKLENIV